MISVIIPIYNVEKYLGRALNSLLDQTYQEWEAILVDDGSTDNSASIANRYCQKDKRFILTRQENQGQGAARNNALKMAGGDYIMYLDPDDIYHPQTMEICLCAALRDNSDMVTFTYSHMYRRLNKWMHRLHLGDIKPWYRHYKNPPYFVTENIFEHAVGCHHPKGVNKTWRIRHCQSWKCLLRADLARKAHFSEGVKYEDVPWWGEILLNVKRTTIFKLPLYFYYPNPTSFMMSAHIEEHIHSLNVILRQTDELYEKARPEQREAWTLNFRNTLHNKLQKMIRKQQSQKL